jgi:hypothetical protein
MLIVPLATLREGFGFAQIGALAIGAICLICGGVGITRKNNVFKVADGLTLFCGVSGVIVGAFALVMMVSAGIGVSLIVAGLLLGGLSWIAWHLPTFTQTKMYSIENQLMIEMKEMIADERGIGIKATLMGAMPATIYVRPNELWNLLSQVSPNVLLAIAKLLVFVPKPPDKEGK